MCETVILLGVHFARCDKALGVPCRVEINGTNHMDYAVEHVSWSEAAIPVSATPSGKV
jgi:hypothetical protein